MLQLENWQLIPADSRDLWAPPTALALALQGTLFGDPARPDGQRVRTACLVLLDLEARVAWTREAVYALGQPAPAFVRALDPAGR
jgi:hypothetical protein